MFKRRKPDDLAGDTLSVPGRNPSEPLEHHASHAHGSFDLDDDGVSEGLLDGGATLPPASLAGSTDTGLGVPPFRPAQPKEAPMGRSPFPAPGSSSALPPAVGPRPSPPPGRPVMPNGPAVAGGREMVGAQQRDAERRTLVVGRGISLQGNVQDAERLVVEGTIEATMINATELAIASGGMFKGEVQVDDAEVAGTIDGTLTVRNTLIVRASGKLLGTARCRRLQVEDGGQITGRIEMLTGEAPPATPAEPVPVASPMPPSFT